MKRLILVEGLPGTGKTTIAEWLSGLLNERGVETVLLTEGDERIPCDFYEMAGIPIREFESLCSRNPAESELLTNGALRTENYAFLRIDKYPDHIAKEMKRWDMGDENNQQISVADYIPCALERLRNWVDANINSSETVVIDSGYLQNPINEVLFRHGTNDEVRGFIQEITNMLKSLNPVCVYLRRNDADEAIAFAKAAKGKGWTDRVDELLKKNHCKDLFRRRFEIELDLLRDIENVICHVYDDNWDDAKELLLNKLYNAFGENRIDDSVFLQTLSD